MLHDYIFLLSNGLGYLAGIFYLCVVYPLSSRKQQKHIMFSLLLGNLIILVGAGLSFCYFVDTIPTYNPIGISTILITILFYASPLSTLIKVVETKNSSSIYLPLSIASLLTGTFWIIYGAILKDWLVMAPQVFTVLFAGIQIVLRILFPLRD